MVSFSEMGGRRPCTSHQDLVLAIPRINIITVQLLETKYTPENEQMSPQKKFDHVSRDIIVGFRGRKM